MENEVFTPNTDYLLLSLLWLDLLGVDSHQYSSRYPAHNSPFIQASIIATTTPYTPSPASASTARSARPDPTASGPPPGRRRDGAWHRIRYGMRSRADWAGPTAGASTRRPEEAVPDGRRF